MNTRKNSNDLKEFGVDINEPDLFNSDNQIQQQKIYWDLQMKMMKKMILKYQHF